MAAAPGIHPQIRCGQARRLPKAATNPVLPSFTSFLGSAINSPVIGQSSAQAFPLRVESVILRGAPWHHWLVAVELADPSNYSAYLLLILFCPVPPPFSSLASRSLRPWPSHALLLTSSLPTTYLPNLRPTTTYSPSFLSNLNTLLLYAIDGWSLSIDLSGRFQSFTHLPPSYHARSSRSSPIIIPGRPAFHSFTWALPHSPVLPRTTYIFTTVFDPQTQHGFYHI